MPRSGQRGYDCLLAALQDGDELSPMSPTRIEPRRSEEPSPAAAAAAGGERKREYVRAVFEQIAPSYDLLNHLLSLNVDRRWRGAAIAALEWQRNPTATYLDLCAGTMDVSAALARTEGFSGRVVAADFAEPMLRAGVGRAPAKTASPVAADALCLPLRDSSVAGAIIAFGARNLADLDAGLREVRRVLTPGGRLVVLEFTTPRSPMVRAAYHAYFHHLLPIIGGMISGHRTAYQYLPESVARFPAEEELATRMRSAGFLDVSWRSLTFGIAAIHVGQR
jgi:demethylmenaquinone methyltransferase/2-methoxy-6-polyprenyl-1,4-benzoquinol methylase